MYLITKKRQLNDTIILFDVVAPRVASHCEPGQFVIVRSTADSERIPLTIADYDRELGTITIVLQTVGRSTSTMAELEVGGYFQDFTGPLGNPSELIHEDIEELKKKRILFVAGGVGTAPVYPQVKWMHNHGVDVDVIVGSKTKDLLIFEEEMRAVAGNYYPCTDDGSYGHAGMVTTMIEELAAEGNVYDLCVCIGPVIMMKFVCQLTKRLNIPTIVSMNAIMVDGTGMCGACRLIVGDEIKFACIDGPEFDGHLVDFDNAMRRQNMYKTQEGRARLKQEEGATHHGGCGNCGDDEIKDEIKNVSKRVPVREQPALIRAKNFKEVCYGYNMEEAVAEAGRCLNCKNPRCVQGCPVNVNIPAFIQSIKNGEIENAYKIISKACC